jgi:hypothetical protein
MNIGKLAAKFDERDIEWRVQQQGKSGNNLWARVFCYITNRAIMARLDAVCGAHGWKNEFKATPCGKGYQCGISIKIGDEWVTRWDGAEISGNGGIDPVKSTMSNSMKRAGVQWGIGRYLYRLETVFTDCVLCDNQREVPAGYNYQYHKGKGNDSSYGTAWRTPDLPSWALPTTKLQIQKHFKDIANAETMEELKTAFKYAFNTAETQDTAEESEILLSEFTQAKDVAKQKLIDDATQVAIEESKAAEEAIQESISVIMASSNESVLNGQTKLALKKAEKIQNLDTQRECIVNINKARKIRLTKLNEKQQGEK